MKNLIILLALALFSHCPLYAEEFNLRIINGYKRNVGVGDTDYTGKKLNIRFLEDTDGNAYMMMSVDNACVMMLSSTRPDLSIDDTNSFELVKKQSEDEGECVDHYSFHDYCVLDNRSSSNYVRFYKRSTGEYILSLLSLTCEGKEPLFITKVVAQIDVNDDYAILSNFFKYNYEKLAAAPYDSKEVETGYEMTSYHRNFFAYSKIIGFDSQYDIMSFFLEVIGGPGGGGDLGELAKHLKRIGEDGSATGTIVVILENGETVQLDHHHMEAVNDNTVMFNLTMDKNDFFKLETSNIIGLKTSGDYTIMLGPDFNSSVTLRYMALLQAFQ